MEQTARSMAKRLGASSIQAAGHNVHFAVDDAQGCTMKVTLELSKQRLMAVLDDPQGDVRATIDVAPISHATEDPATPGRVTLHVGQMRVHLDSQPTLAIEVESAALP